MPATCRDLHPRKQTCPIKRRPFQSARIVFQPGFFRGHVSCFFSGEYLTFTKLLLRWSGLASLHTFAQDKSHPTNMKPENHPFWKGKWSFKLSFLGSVSYSSNPRSNESYLHDSWGHHRVFASFDTFQQANLLWESSPKLPRIILEVETFGKMGPWKRE